MALDESCSAATTTPLTLRRLLDTQQATAVIPGVLYFATTGECLSSAALSSATLTSSPISSEPATVTDVFKSTNRTSNGDPLTSPPQQPLSPPPFAAIAASALRNFFLKENKWVQESDTALPDIVIPTTSAAVGHDAVFVAPRGVPPYVYKPFFADFGPLDVGCCVHFARRLRELLAVISKTDLRGGSAAAAATTATRTTSPISADSTPGRTQTTLDSHRSSSSEGPTASLHPSFRANIKPRTASRTTTAAATLNSSSSSALPVVICASLNAQERVNTACLVGAFCVLVLGWSTAATWSRVFADIYPSFLTYRDASKGVSNFPLSLQDVWSGLEHAVHLGWVSVDGFDLDAYWEGKAKDVSWIVPRRFLAMSSPRDDDPQRTAEVFARRLRAMNVRLVVRLNDSLYQPGPLLRLGIRHVDLPYADGSIPTDALLLEFLRATEEHFGETVPAASLRQWWSAPNSIGIQARRPHTTSHGSVKKKKPQNKQEKPSPQYVACSLLHSGKYRGMPDTRTAVAPPSRDGAASARAQSSGDAGAVAVHCLAGLGRTGTMIAVYMMRHYGFTARGVIGWTRLCRPGSITGVQQQYLDTVERRLRPSPYVFAAQVLSDMFVQAARQSRRAASSSSSSSSSLSAGGTSSAGVAGGAAGTRSMLTPRGGATVERALEMSGVATLSSDASSGVYTRADTVEPPWPANVHSALSKAFQAHGTVAADARPPTSVAGGGPLPNSPSSHPHSGISASHRLLSIGGGGGGGGDFVYVQKRESGQWADRSNLEAPQGLLLRQPRLASLQQPQPQHLSLLQPQRRRSSSTSTMSFGSDHPGNTALDAVSSMPVLGKDAPERLRSTTPAISAATAPVMSIADTRTGSVNGGIAAGGARAVPRAGDFKYASTYFVALERANGRLPPPPPGAWAATSALAGTTTNAVTAGSAPGTTTAVASASPPFNSSTAAAAAAGARGMASPHEKGQLKGPRAATASHPTQQGGLARRMSRLDGVAVRPPTAPPHHPSSKQLSGGGSIHSGVLSRGESFGQRSAVAYNRRKVSLTSTATISGVPFNDGAALRSATTTPATDANEDPQQQKQQHRPYTATGSLSPTLTSVHTNAPSSGGPDSSLRLRHTPPKPPRGGQPNTQRRLSLRSSPHSPLNSFRRVPEVEVGTAEDMGTFPTLPQLSSMDGGEEMPRTRYAVSARGTTGAHRPAGAAATAAALSSRSGAIPAAVMPLWGRPVGHA